MKKILLIVAVIAVIVGIVFLVRNRNEEGTGSQSAVNQTQKVDGVDLSTPSGAAALIEKIYQGNEENMPVVMTNEINLSEQESVKSYAGLDSIEGIEYIVVSEPIIGSIAHSLVLVRVQDGEDVEAVKNEMFENIDTRKWICAEASNMYATDYDNTVIFVMSDDMLATMVETRVDEILGDAKGDVLIEANEFVDGGFDTGIQGEQEHLGDPVASL